MDSAAQARLVLHHQVAPTDSSGVIAGLIGSSCDVQTTIAPEELSPQFSAALQTFECQLPQRFSLTSLAEACYCTTHAADKATVRPDTNSAQHEDSQYGRLSAAT